MAEVRAKFKCYSMRKYESNIWTDGKMSSGFAFEYEFQVVSGKDGENAKFFASTPSGSMKLTAVRDDLFVPGKEYYLDFTLAKELVSA